MLMVKIWKVRVVVLQVRMLVLMGVRLLAVPFKIVGVLVVRVVPVPMPMRKRGVLMIMCMALGEVQPDARRHQGSSQQKGGAGGLRKNSH